MRRATWSCVVVLLVSSIHVYSRSLTPSDDETKREAVNYLSRFGYLAAPQASAYSRAETLRSTTGLTTAIRQFQRFAQLPETGTLDNVTVAKMKSPRCGVVDITDGVGRRKKRFKTNGDKWKSKHLTFRIQNFSPDLDSSIAEDAIRRAIYMWMAVADLSFHRLREGDEETADINFVFYRGEHSDGNPFDGKGVILAHAFPPGDNIGGDVHFDEDEKWSAYQQTEGHVDLFSVTVHELGHALGLGHSSVPSAIMYPWYQFFTPRLSLQDDDINGIHYLYGASKSMPSRMPSPEAPTSSVTHFAKVDSFPDPCTAHIDAVTLIRGDLFMFSGKYHWRLNDRGLRVPYGYLASHFWNGLPSHASVDAVVEYPKSGLILFFSGHQYWQFTGTVLVADSPRNLTDLGLSARVKRIDAAFIWPYNKRIYLFSGDLYWKLDERGRYAEVDYPRPINTVWHGLPSSHIDAAFADAEENMYFIKDDNYWKFDHRRMRASTNYPRSFSRDWIKCQTKNFPIDDGQAPSNNDNNRSHAVRDGRLSSPLALLSLCTVLYFFF